MSNISSTSIEHQAISKKTATYFMMAVTFYMMFSSSGWDPLTAFCNMITASIPNTFAQILTQVITTVLTSGLLYVIIYERVQANHIGKWKKQHKDHWIKGTWLHVHDKPNVRIGDVIIDQDFFTLAVDGHNVCVPQIRLFEEITKEKLDEADWKYSMAKLVSQNNNEYQLTGYYDNSHGKGHSKDGMHLLDITKVSGYPIFMHGTFGDVVTEDKQEIKNSVGQLRLYRLEETCPYYQRIMNPKTDRVDYKRLVLLVNEFILAKQAKLNNETVEFALYDLIYDDPFLNDVAEVIEKHGWKVI